MTEDEAKTKWCHQTKRDVETYDELGTIRCVGSGCMAWRWDEKNVYNKHGDMIGEGVTTYGHCGLAGQP